MKATVHHSQDIDSAEAIDELLRDAGPDWGDRAPDAGLVYAGIDHDLGVLNTAVLDRWPDLQLIGCTGDGELSSVHGKSDDSVVLMLLGSDRVRFGAGAGRNLSVDPARATRDAVNQALDSIDPSDVRFCLALLEGVGIDGAEVVDHLRDAVPDGVPIVGGMAGDQGRFVASKQSHGREELRDSVCVLLFSGPLLVSTASGHGWTPVGDRYQVTRADGHLVREIANRPAADLYDRFIGGHSLHFPLAVYPENDGEFYLAASPEAHSDGSLVVLNRVTEGATVRLADATPDEVIGAADDVAGRALAGMHGSMPGLGLVFSCGGRRALLGSRVGEEVERLRERLPSDIGFGGFYSYAEICSLRGQNVARTHNGTLVLALLGEE